MNMVLKKLNRLVLKKYPESGNAIIEKACEYYSDMISENKNEPSKVRTHTQIIYASIAVYRAIDHIETDQEAAYNLIAAYYANKAEKTQKILRTILKTPGLYKIIPFVMAKLIVSVFGEASGFKMTIHETSRERCHIDMISCPYFDKCRKYGCAELTTAFCNSDDIAYGNMHPKAKWLRNKCLGRGNDLCNFIIEMKK